MKRIFSLLFVLTVCCIVKAQDTIVFVKDPLVVAKVLTIEKNKISYKKYNNIDGPVYIADSHDIYYIRYSNGDKEIYNESTKIKKENIEISNKNLINNESGNLPLEVKDVVEKQKEKVYWSVDIGTGFQLVNPSFAIDRSVVPGFETGVQAKAEFKKYFAVGFGLNYVKQEFKIRSLRESTFIENWEDRENYSEIDGWVQNGHYLSLQGELQLLYNPFNHINCIDQNFKGYFYIGAICCANMHAWGETDGMTWSMIYEIGMKPIYYIKDHFGIFVDASYQILSDKYAGYSVNKLMPGVSTTVGISLRF